MNTLLNPTDEDRDETPPAGDPDHSDGAPVGRQIDQAGRERLAGLIDAYRRAVADAETKPASDSNLFDVPEGYRIPPGVLVEAFWHHEWVPCVMKGTTLCLGLNRGHVDRNAHVRVRRDAFLWVTHDDPQSIAPDRYAAVLRSLGFRFASAGER